MPVRIRQRGHKFCDYMVCRVMSRKLRYAIGRIDGLELHAYLELVGAPRTTEINVFSQAVLELDTCAKIAKCLEAG